MPARIVLIAGVQPIHYMARRIALIASAQPYGMPIYKGVVACAKEVGPWFVEVRSGNTPGLGQSSGHVPFDGIIAVFQSEAALAQIARSGVPVVGIGEQPPGFSAVTHDNAAIGDLGARHLQECGLSRCAYYGIASNWSIERFDGFAGAINRRNRTSNLSQERWPAFAHAARIDSAKAFLKHLPHPAGIMAANDVLARVLLDAALEMGLRIPGDVAVIGVNNDELMCETGAIGLSSIDTDPERMGYEASRLLDRLMHQKPAQTLRVAPRGIVQRESTSAIPVTDPDIAMAIRFIQKNACRGIGVDDLCDHLAISRRRLERRFREISGRSPGEEIRRIRMDRARTLLADTDMSIADITIQCGYAHSSSFVAAFHETVGQTPAHYRRQSRGEPPNAADPV